jgi:hypothetical protein
MPLLANVVYKGIAPTPANIATVKEELDTNPPMVRIEMWWSGEIKEAPATSLTPIGRSEARKIVKR